MTTRPKELDDWDRQTSGLMYDNKGTVVGAGASIPNPDYQPIKMGAPIAGSYRSLETTTAPSLWRRVLAWFR